MFPLQQALELVLSGALSCVDARKRVSTATGSLDENATSDLAAFASALCFDDLLPDVVERIKLCALDSFGCALFGATLPWTRKVAQLASEERARPSATLIGMGRKT